MTEVDALLFKLMGDGTSFEAMMKKAEGTLKIFDTKMYESAKRTEQLTTKLNVMAVKFTAAGFAIEQAGMRIAGVFMNFTRRAFDASVRFDSLMLGLEAMAGSSQAAQKQLERLREVAKLPGLGLEEAIQGSISLQAVGVEAQSAERALMAFGNALATVGKGRVELAGVNLAISQIYSKGKVQAEEINQIAERMPQIRQAMKDAFGTADTEELQKQGLTPEDFLEGILTQLEKLPRMGDSTANSMENLGDAINQLYVEIGHAMQYYITPLIDKFSSMIAWLNELDPAYKNLVGTVASVGAIFGSSLMVIGSMATTFGGLSVAISGAISMYKSLTTAIYAAVAAQKAYAVSIVASRMGGMGGAAGALMGSGSNLAVAGATLGKAGLVGAAGIGGMMLGHRMPTLFDGKGGGRAIGGGAESEAMYAAALERSNEMTKKGLELTQRLHERRLEAVQKAMPGEDRREKIDEMVKMALNNIQGLEQSIERQKAHVKDLEPTIYSAYLGGRKVWEQEKDRLTDITAKMEQYKAQYQELIKLQDEIYSRPLMPKVDSMLAGFNQMGVSDQYNRAMDEVQGMEWGNLLKMFTTGERAVDESRIPEYLPMDDRDLQSTLAGMVTRGPQHASMIGLDRDIGMSTEAQRLKPEQEHRKKVEGFWGSLIEEVKGLRATMEDKETPIEVDITDGTTS